MSIEFETAADGTAIGVLDTVERRHLTFHTPRPVSPRSVPAEDADFRYPVDGAVAATLSRLWLDEVPDVFVRDDDGRTVGDVDPGDEVELSGGPFEVELNGSVKLYVRIPGPVTVTAGIGRVDLALDGEREVVVGGRSYHRQPAGTVRTTDDPADVMAAVSTFGSALKTTSSERSYPTLRGHPPAVALGDELDVPDGLERPETGVRLVVPPARQAAYIAAPLSYYLGAELLPGEPPRLELDGAGEHELDAEGFPSAIQRTLERAFFLDCLVRTEGRYQFDLRERAAVEPDVDLEFGALYGEPLVDRLAAYLDVPYGTIEPHLPRWQTAAHLPPAPELAETLPFLVDDLAVVRPAEGRELSPADVRSTVLREYVADGGGTRRRGSRAGPEPDGTPVLRPEPTDALQQVWFGEGIPLGASKGVTSAYRNRLDRTPRRDAIDITVVGNGGLGPAERDIAGTVYGSREDLPFDVTLRRELSTGELARTLESDVDFLHYVGHIDETGFRCRDGSLRAHSLDGVGVDSFLLNACRSYREGVELVERGSVGGVVTFSEVLDDAAVAIGRAMARLLHLGFPLRAALSTARTENVAGGQYLVVGDGTADVVQARHGAPLVSAVEQVDGADEYEVTLRAYLPSEGGMGSVANPYLRAADGHYLAPGDIGPFRVPEEELREFLALYRDPVEKEGELTWNDSPGPPAL